MKNSLNKLLLAALLCTSTGNVFAETDEATNDTESKAWSVDLATDFATDYMFRGQNLYDGTSIQPYAGLNYDLGDAGVITASSWAHFTAETDRKDENYTEVDYTISYALTVDALTFSIGHNWYTYPHKNFPIERTNEIIATISADMLLNPTFTYAHDYEEFDYDYFELQLSHTFEGGPLGEGFNTTPYVLVGFSANSEKVYDDEGVSHVAAGTSSDLELGVLTLTPSVNYNFKVDDLTVNEFWTMMSVGYSF